MLNIAILAHVRLWYTSSGHLGFIWNKYKKVRSEFDLFALKLSMKMKKSALKKRRTSLIVLFVFHMTFKLEHGYEFLRFVENLWLTWIFCP